MNNVNPMIPLAPSNVPSQGSSNIEPIRRKRTRAKRSCDKCRIKKTRCDAYLRHPCTKCSLSDSSCTFLVEQKKRGPSSGNYVEVLENRLLRMEKLLKKITKDKQNYSNTDSDTGLEFEQESSVSSATNNNEDSSPPPNKDCTHNSSDDTLHQQLQKLSISDYERTRYIGASSGIHFLGEEIMKSRTKRRISADPTWFVQKLNDENEEHVFMKSKEVESPAFDPTKNMNTVNRAEAFDDLPSMTQDFLDHLIHMYFTRMHTICPIINKVQFLEQYYLHSPSPPDKYILYTMAYNIVTVFKSDIINTGFLHFSEEQLDQLADSLKEKSYHLLSFVYKRSTISTVQALTILSMVVKFEDTDEEDTSHWLISGMAIRMAQDLGLHRDCSKWPIPDYEIENRKRIWYSVYLMDRLIAADLGRPVSIIDNEFEVGLPSTYELTYQSKLLGQNHNNTPVLILEAEESRQRQNPVYSAFVNLVTLAQIIGQILVGLHSPKAKHARYRSIELVDILDKNLTSWRLSLPHELQVDINSVKDHVSPGAAIVHMTYLCALLLLYRPFIIENSNLAFRALGICTSAATDILNFAEMMDRDYFLALPWNMSVYCTFQAAIILLYNAKGGNEYFKEYGRQNLLRCMDIYQREPFLRTNRIVQILYCIVNNFDEPLVEVFCLSTKSKGRQGTKQGSAPGAPPVTNFFSTSCNYSLSSSACKPPTTGNLGLVNSDAQTTFQNGNPDTNTSASLTRQLKHDIGSLVQNFTSTRPEDIFMSSLTLSLGGHSTDEALSNNSDKQLSNESQQQQVYQILDQTDPSVKLSHTLHTSSEQQAFNQDSVVVAQQKQNIQFNHPQYPDFTSHNNYPQYQHTPNNTVSDYHLFDSSSLSSRLPIWDLPIGATWNAWEAFLKNTV